MRPASPVTRWMSFNVDDTEHYGTVDGETVTEWSGGLFSERQPTEHRHALADVRPLMPCRPSKLIGLWNNSRERAVKEAPCGTGVGAVPMDHGDTVEIVVDGIGRLLSSLD